MKRQIRLLAQADLLLLIADLFRPPEKIRHFLGNLEASNLTMLIKATGLAQPTRLSEQLHTAITIAGQANQDEWSGCYRLLFDGSIICPVNEAGYIRRDKGAIIGDVCGFYKAFGWTAVEKTGERPDHLLVELEFAAMLLVMSARAESREQAEVAESALASFTRHHLSDWIIVFCNQLKLSTSYPVLVEAANLLELVWPELVKWHRWIVDPSPASTAGICGEPENPYECGAPDLVSLNSDKTH
jgi:TorA maturation chaperone TorD